jgi:hypothetical protein
MVRFAIARQVSFSGREGWASGKVELPAFMHDALLRPVLAQLPQRPPLAPMPQRPMLAPLPPLAQLPLANRREAVASSESVLASHDKPSVAAPPRVRPPSMLGMPWRWL